MHPGMLIVSILCELMFAYGTVQMYLRYPTTWYSEPTFYLFVVPGVLFTLYFVYFMLSPVGEALEEEKEGD